MVDSWGHPALVVVVLGKSVSVHCLEMVGMDMKEAVLSRRCNLDYMVPSKHFLRCHCSLALQQELV